MRPIDRFILHVTHNLFPLNEYSEGEMKRLIDQFREEADDLNINVTDEQLKAYIERFDQIKNSPKIDEKDLRKYTLSKLIKLVTASKGTDIPDAADITPDVVYDENGLVIYNGSKEDNCVRYGNGERWCITRGSFGNYRYDSNRKNPTFYLVRDTNLSDSDPKSFFVVVVGSDNTYKVSDRTNNDYGHGASEWQSWEPWSFVEQNFPSIRGLRSTFKYIPLSSTEKLNQSYKNNPISIREWIKMPYSVKEQYLVVRKGKQLFSDISNEDFIEKYLPKYPQIAAFISTNFGIVDSSTLIKYLDKFSNQDTRSIIANMRDKIDLKYLSSESVPFEVKKFLVKQDKWDVPSNERLYVTKDGNAIVKLKLGEDIQAGVYTEDDDYPNIKLNKRTSKYLLDYPELDKIPFNNLIKLAEDGVIDKNVLDTVVKNAKTDPNSAIVVKDTPEGQILVDSNAFTAYKLEGDKVTKIPFNNEEVLNIVNNEEDNTAFQKSAFNLFKNGENIPETIDRDGITAIVNSTPFDQRTTTIPGYTDLPVVLLTTPDNENSFFFVPTNPGDNNLLNVVQPYGRGNDWRIVRNQMGEATPQSIEAYINYLRNENKTISDDALIRTLKGGGYSSQSEARKKIAFVRANPPIGTNNRYAPVMNGDTALLINKANPRESFKISDTSGKLVKANVPSSLANRLLGQAAPARAERPTAPAAAPAAQGAGDREEAPIARRGRPAGGGAPRAQGPAGDVSVTGVLEAAGLDTSFLRLPRNDYRRLNVNDARQLPVANDRGASRRNNMLGNAGQVVRVLATPSGSTIYIIRLANDQLIASVVVQPGNRHYILTGNENGNNAIQLNSPAELMQALQQRNLAEHIKKAATKMYLAENPNMLSETADMIKKLINKR